MKTTDYNRNNALPAPGVALAIAIIILTNRNYRAVISQSDCMIVCGYTILIFSNASYTFKVAPFALIKRSSSCRCCFALRSRSRRSCFCFCRFSSAIRSRIDLSYLSNFARYFASAKRTAFLKLLSSEIAFSLLASVSSPHIFYSAHSLPTYPGAYSGPMSNTRSK